MTLSYTLTPEQFANIVAHLKEKGFSIKAADPASGDEQLHVSSFGAKVDAYYTRATGGLLVDVISPPHWPLDDHGDLNKFAADINEQITAFLT